MMLPQSYVPRMRTPCAYMVPNEICAAALMIHLLIDV